MWKRLPVDLKKKSRDLSLLWKLVSLLLQRDFASFFAQASAASAANALTVPLLARMLTTLIEEVRVENLKAMQSAYAVVSSEVAAPLLGVQSAQVGPLLLQQGWTQQAAAAAAGAGAATGGAAPAGSLFVPPAAVASKSREITKQQLQQLTGYIAHLED